VSILNAVGALVPPLLLFHLCLSAQGLCVKRWVVTVVSENFLVFGCFPLGCNDTGALFSSRINIVLFLGGRFLKPVKSRLVDLCKLALSNGVSGGVKV